MKIGDICYLYLHCGYYFLESWYKKIYIVNKFFCALLQITSVNIYH